MLIQLNSACINKRWPHFNTQKGPSTWKASSTQRGSYRIEFMNIPWLSSHMNTLPQGPSASSDSLLGCETHGVRSVWLWLWRCSGAPHELCLAKHLWDFSTHGAVFQWCCGGTASSRGPRESAPVHNAGRVKGHSTAVIQWLFEGGAAHTSLTPVCLLSSLQGLFHPARKVREVYWKIYNNLYIGSQVSWCPLGHTFGLDVAYCIFRSCSCTAAMQSYLFMLQYVSPSLQQNRKTKTCNWPVIKHHNLCTSD